MANKMNFFKTKGAMELSRELKELSRGAQNKILRPGLRQGAAEIRKIAKRIVPVDTGLLKKSLKSKVFTEKGGARGKGVTARIGVLTNSGADKNGVPVAKYGGGVNRKVKFLERASRKGEKKALDKFIKVSQQKLDDFHAKQPKVKP
jgi:hypothetical protein